MDNVTGKWENPTGKDSITIRSSAKTETLRGGYSITALLPQKNYTSGEEERQQTAHGAQG
ncbi:hypothetical protein B7P43_G14983 [Cryptotermes secundus]|uniref:Uncharacterized protein n=1 Tax=Cryptotermes secundus TaxID=105785 RepID=A0A2J7RJ87_9NEOP|nr:hypothetical protein B7P43_G14983 [Cryptotermes secundus]